MLVACVVALVASSCGSDSDSAGRNDGGAEETGSAGRDRHHDHRHRTISQPARRTRHRRHPMTHGDGAPRSAPRRRRPRLRRHRSSAIPSSPAWWSRRSTRRSTWPYVPATTALFVVEQRGTCRAGRPGHRRYHARSSISPTASHQVASRACSGSTFSADGSLAYINYTDRSGDTVIAEYAVADDGTIDPATQRVLLDGHQPYRNHNAGDLALGPDGMLYVTLGDGGSGGDPERRAGDPTSLLGSLLRIDPTPSSAAPYSIPADNPFASRLVRRSSRRAGGLGVGIAQPLEDRLRPDQRRPLDRRRRTEPVRGGRCRARRRSSGRIRPVLRLERLRGHRTRSTATSTARA